MRSRHPFAGRPERPEFAGGFMRGPRRREFAEALIGDQPEFGFRRGPRGGGPGRGRRGDVRNAILALLAESTLNGYQIIQAVAEKTDGLWRPGPGSVYPALTLLTDEGLIEPIDADGKKVFTLTDEGRTYVAEHADQLADPWNQVAGPHAGLLDVRQEAGQLALALKQVAMTGNPAQVKAAREVLDSARKSLYRILAEDTPAEDES